MINSIVRCEITAAISHLVKQLTVGLVPLCISLHYDPRSAQVTKHLLFQASPPTKINVGLLYSMVKSHILRPIIRTNRAVMFHIPWL